LRAESLGRKYDRVLAYTLILPVAFVIFIVIGIPFVQALYLSLTNKTVGVTPAFVGLKNYATILTDPDYWKVLRNTFVYMFACVTVKLILGMILAVVLNEKFVGRGLFRGIFLVPWALSGMVTAMTWRWMYDDTYGILNSMLMRWGVVDTPIPWISGIHIALISCILVDVWRGIPFFMFSLLGGLQTIDQQMYEAATIDGAGWIRQFFSITIPSVMPVIAITTLLSSIWTFNDFENIFLVTGGGPLHASAVISVYTYEVAFLQNAMGKSLAVAGSVIPILVVMIIVATRKLNTDD
jgi:multiple sugar transport system permease protein